MSLNLQVQRRQIYNIIMSTIRVNPYKPKPHTKREIKEQDESDMEDLSTKPRKFDDYISKAYQKNLKANKFLESQSSSILKDCNNQAYKKYIEQIRLIEGLEPHLNDLKNKYNDPELIKYIESVRFNDENLCFHGFGSKIEFLSGLREHFYSDSMCWEVRAYLPAMNVKKIFNDFGVFLKAANVMKTVHHTTIKEQLAEYRQNLIKYESMNPEEKLVILFHSIDSPNLMTTESQHLLSQLFSLPGLKLVCTMSSAKMPMLWSPSFKQRIKFVFFQIDTHFPSTQEQIFQPNPSQKTDRTEKRIMNIVQALNANQKRILKILAKHQLENFDKEVQTHLTVSQLLDMCIDEVILSTDTQLRQNLLQLLDHDVITEKQSSTHRKKTLIMNLDKRLLQKLCDLKVQ